MRNGVFFVTDNAARTLHLDLTLVGPDQSTNSNTIIKMNRLTDKRPLAVTIQIS
jgi:hypothetical protein